MSKSCIKNLCSQGLASLMMLCLMTVAWPARAAEISLHHHGELYVLKAKKTTIKAVLKYIEQQGNYAFVYDQSVEKRLNESVSLDLQGRSMEDILSELCQMASLDYSINGKQVVITIDEKNLEQVFSNLKTVKKLRDTYEGKDEISYEKYLSEFVGIYGTLVFLDLENRWQKWQIEHLDD